MTDTRLAIEEISKLRRILAEIVGCTCRPDPLQPARIDVAKGRHKAFGDAIARAHEMLETLAE